MKRITLLTLIIMLILISCGHLGLRKPNITEEDEYEIINAVIDSLFSTGEFIHLVQLAGSDVSLDNIKYYLDQEDFVYDTLMLTDYALKNDTLHFWDNTKLNDPARCISFDRYFGYFASSSSNEGWTGYYRDFPNSSGVLSFYRPGIDPSCIYAVLEFSLVSHYLAGQGYIALLEKQNETWNIIRIYYTWVS